MLARRGTARLASADNLPMSIGQFAQKIEVFVVHKHGTWTDAINTNGVLLGNLLRRGFSFSEHSFQSSREHREGGLTMSAPL